jgi:hypothetical protein
MISGIASHDPASSGGTVRRSSRYGCAGPRRYGRSDPSADRCSSDTLFGRLNRLVEGRYFRPLQRHPVSGRHQPLERVWPDRGAPFAVIPLPARFRTSLEPVEAGMSRSAQVSNRAQNRQSQPVHELPWTLRPSGRPHPRYPMAEITGSMSFPPWMVVRTVAIASANDGAFDGRTYDPWIGRPGSP